jgi:hypothetical protein
MHKKFFFALLLVILLSQFAVVSVLAAGEPIGSCAPGFTLMMAMEHDEHEHQHVGTDADLNGDGWICMKHVTPVEKLHLHVDNNLP